MFIPFFSFTFFKASFHEIDSLYLYRPFCAPVFWHCWLGDVACRNRPRNDLLCVTGLNAESCSLTHSAPSGLARVERVSASFLAKCCRKRLNRGRLFCCVFFVLGLSVCIELWILHTQKRLVLPVSTKWLAVKTASKWHTQCRLGH